MKTDVHKDKKFKGGLYNKRKSCRKQYYDEKLVKIRKFNSDNKDKGKECYSNKRDRINEYHSKGCDKTISRKKTHLSNGCIPNVHFYLVHKIRNSIRLALKGKKIFFYKWNLRYTY